MVKEGTRKEWKNKFFVKMIRLLDEYPKCFIVGADNVGSSQMQQIRIQLRGFGVILMGKNTMMKKAIRGHLEKNPNLEKLLPFIYQNVGFVFTKLDLSSIREKIQSNQVAAPAKAGAIAPCDVVLPAQVTSLGPEKTSFFQALQITSKITRGTIEIVNDINLIKKGDKVGASEAALLNMLKISPFSYGLSVLQVYDNGTVFSPDILDVTPQDLRNKFMEGVKNVAAISLKIGYPTVASAPHSIANGFKNLLAIAAATNIEFEQCKQLKEYLKNPGKFAAAAAPAAAPAAKAETKAAAAPKKEEKKEESGDEDMGFGLFD
jgi:large subunit ribosomal protein LP0